MNDVSGVLANLSVQNKWVHFVFYFFVRQSRLPDSWQSTFGWNLAGGIIENSDFGAEL